MGAVAPVTPWSAKDDLLLKKALENGASLESLAKGAVQFSRRFTITEIQDRWNSLLYDVNTSIEASVRMIKFEHSALKPTSKLKRAGNSKSKENDCGHGKRKAESIRGCYYAWRKRMHIEALNPGNLSFLGNSYNISESEAPCVKNMLPDQIENRFGLQDTSFNDLSVFPQVMRNKAPLCGVGEFPSEQPKRLEDFIEQNSVQKEIPLGNSIAMVGNCPRLGQTDLSNKLPKGRYIIQAIESNLASNGKDTMSISYGENTIFNSPVPDCETSFNPMQYTSTPPAMPDWEEIEGVSIHGLPDDITIKENNVLTGEPSSISDGGGAAKGTSEYNIINVEPFNPSNNLSCDEMKTSTDCTEDYFVELANILFDFTNEEMLEDAIDKSYLDGLSSLLLNSPYDADDEMPKVSETEEPAVPVVYPDIVSTDPEQKICAAEIHLGVQECTSGNQIPTSATVNSQLLEYCNGVLSCTLNTEDPEIPRNDHIVLSGRARRASAPRRTQSEANYLKMAGKDGNGNLASEGPCSIILELSDSGNLQPGVGGINQKGKAPPIIRGWGCYVADFTTTEPAGEPLSSDQSEEQFSESDGDIPCFSEIEAMILGMDLWPDDEDSFCSRQVAKYQDEGAMRAIIRLEQQAHSKMQRGIAEHGALANLCGRHSTYYIKKPEVLLGRGADDVPVDIDLGREGRSNTISRRQAIIKMDKDGTFYMTNLGKRSIFVGEHEISKGERLRLHSYCLIQIRQMSFMFVIGEACVKQYLSNGARKS